MAAAALPFTLSLFLENCGFRRGASASSQWNVERLSSPETETKQVMLVVGAALVQPGVLEVLYSLASSIRIVLPSSHLPNPKGY